MSSEELKVYVRKGLGSRESILVPYSDCDLSTFFDRVGEALGRDRPIKILIGSRSVPDTKDMSLQEWYSSLKGDDMPPERYLPRLNPVITPIFNVAKPSLGGTRSRSKKKSGSRGKSRTASKTGHKCGAKTKDGGKCSRACAAGSKKCFQHKK